MHAARWVKRIDEHGRSYGVGKRKTSVALVWVKRGTGQMQVNRRPYDQYFPDLLRRNDVLAPFMGVVGCGAVRWLAVGCQWGGGGRGRMDWRGKGQGARHGMLPPKEAGCYHLCDVFSITAHPHPPPPPACCRCCSHRQPRQV